MIVRAIFFSLRNCRKSVVQSSRLFFSSLILSSLSQWRSLLYTFLRNSMISLISLSVSVIKDFTSSSVFSFLFETNVTWREYLSKCRHALRISGDNGFGRLDLVEDRLVGLKSRECYEVPGALTLITAHKALEDICVEGDLLKTKIKLEQDWATAVYNGQWYSPLKNALDAFMADTQKFVTGTVRLKFFKGNCHVVGRKSPFSLYDYGLATYDRDTTFDEKASAGFIEIDTLSLKTWAEVQGPSSAAAQA